MTTREREVASMVADGLTRKEIATNLGIETRTVDALLLNIARRLNIRGPGFAVRLTRYAIASGLVSAPTISEFGGLLQSSDMPVNEMTTFGVGD